MAKKFNEKLIELLKTDARFVDDEGELVKAAVIDRTWKIDRNLVKLLLRRIEVKDKFFNEIEGHWIFDINTFIEYISDKKFLANSYTRFRNQIGLNIGGKFLRERGEVSLVWPYKDCVLEGGQTKEDEKRKELFFNEILAQDEINRLFDPKVLTHWKRHTVDGEQTVTEIKRDKNDAIRENLIIKGNNLLALHTLTKQFRSKVKLIYIDPPYNIGNGHFGYNDRFNHSTWLTFMKNRLQIAKELLRKDGIIWISIDDNEVHYLKVLADEVFGVLNFMTSFYVQVRYENKTLVEDMDYQKLIETVLVYRRSKQGKLKKEEEDYTIDKFVWKINELGKPRQMMLGGKKVEVFSKEQYEIVKSEPAYNNLKEIWASGKVLDANSSGRFFRDYLTDRYEKDGYGAMYKVYDIGDDQFDYRYFTGPKKHGATKGKYYQGVPKKRLSGGNNKKYVPISNFEDLADAFGNCRHEGGVELRSGKKPERLIKRILDLSTEAGDLVLDFFAGSGTTAAVAHKMGRRFITVEQMDYTPIITVERLKKVVGRKVKPEGKMFEEIEFDRSGISKSINWQGGGNFIYCELMQYNEAYMDKIQAAKSSNELVELWKKIAENSFLNWYVNPEMPEDAVDDFIEIGKTENGLDKQKKLLAELLNKNQLYLNLSEIEDEDFKVSKEDKKLNGSFYGETC